MDLNVILIIVATIYVLLWIIELVGLHRFNLRFFNKGFKVYEKIVKHKFSNWNNLDDIYSEKEGRYVFLSDEKVGSFVSKFYYHKIYSPIASFRGIPLIHSFLTSSGSLAVISVSIKPGAIALHLMLREPNS